MDNLYLKKAKIFNTCFGVYGYGNFDITTKHLSILLSILDNPNAKKDIIDFYYDLEKQRLG